jgi:hypothetical protein
VCVVVIARAANIREKDNGVGARNRAWVRADGLWAKGENESGVPSGGRNVLYLTCGWVYICVCERREALLAALISLTCSPFSVCSSSV